MSKKTQDDQDDDINDFDGDTDSDEVVPDFKADAALDKKLSLERRRKIEERIELYRVRDACGFYDLEI